MNAHANEFLDTELLRTATLVAVLLLSAIVPAVAQPTIDGRFGQRIEAANAIADSDDMTTDRKGELLLEALRNELAEPTETPTSRWLGGSLSRSEHLHVVYYSLLAKVLTPEAIWQRVQGIGEQKKPSDLDRGLQRRLLFCFADAMEDRADLDGLDQQRKHAIGGLAKMLQESPDDFERAMAARSLGYLRASDRAPLLKEALSDPAFRHVKRDVKGPGPHMYLVRLEAAMALKRLGYTIIRSDTTQWEVVEDDSRGYGPDDVARMHKRVKAAFEALDAAEAGRLTPALQLLRQELGDPLPRELPHGSNAYTASEGIQIRAMLALSRTSQPDALVETYERIRAGDEPDIAARVVMALGISGRASLDTSAEDRGILRRCTELLRQHPADFIRASAGRALRHIGEEHPDLKPLIRPPLRAALKDEATRPNPKDDGDPVYPVREAAQGALFWLDYDRDEPGVLPRTN